MRGFIQSRYSVTMWLLYIATLLTVVVGGRYQHTSRLGHLGPAGHPMITFIGGDHVFFMVLVGIGMSICMGEFIFLYFNMLGEYAKSERRAFAIGLLGIPADAANIFVMTKLVWAFGFSLLGFMVLSLFLGFTAFFIIKESGCWDSHGSFIANDDSHDGD